MQITLVSSGDTVSHILNRFETKFSLNWVEIKEEFSHLIVPMPNFLIKKYSIRELKAMTDFLATAFKVTDLDIPKRNSKVSLAGWVAKVLLSAREVAEASGVIGDQATDSFTECLDCGFVHKPFQNTLCPHGEPSPQIIDFSPEIEVLEPEEKPVYTISIIAEGKFSEERVNRLPPYLIDRKSKLLKKFWHRNCDAGYVEIVSEHLSNIARDSGLVVTLMAENLEVSRSCIVGDPPPFLIHGGGVYKRDHLKLSLAVRYFQVISEHLSSILVV